MTLLNQYYGATKYIKGASYLDTKTLLNIQEGYKIGATIEYIDLGDFEVSDFTNTGAFNQTLLLNAHSPVKRLNYNNTFLGRTFKSHHTFFDAFVEGDSINRNWAQFDGGWKIASNQLQFDRNDTADTSSNIAYTGNQNINDFRVIVKCKCDQFDTAGADNNISISFNMQKFVKGQENGYRFSLIGDDEDELRVSKVVNGAVTHLASGVAFNPANDTWYWLMVVKRGNRIRCYSSTDGRAYTERFDVVDNTYIGGGIGIRCFGAAESVDFYIDSVDVVEIGNQYAMADILRHTLAMGGVFDAWIQPELNGVSSFVASAGSSWVAGNTNGYQQVDLYNTATGNSWHTFMNVGATFDNFIFEFEMRGASSSNYAGGVLGTTNNWYGNYHRTTTTVNQSVEHYMNARFTYGGRGDYINIQPDTWYKYKIVKNNLFVGWYINDVLVNSIYGTSLADRDGLDNRVGLFGYRNGISGTVTSFRDIKISKLDNLAGDVTIEPNTPLSSTFNRFLPRGYAVNWHGATVEIFEVGASRGEHGISQYIQNSNEDISNITGDKLVVARGENTIVQTINTDTRVTNQVDSMRIQFLQDQNIKNITDAENLAKVDLRLTNKNIQQYDVNIVPRIDMENYDTVNFIDETLGVSKQMLVFGFDKKYDATKGSFRQSLQLADK